MSEEPLPKNSYSAYELAELRLPGKPTTAKGWYQLVEREGWREIKAISSGRGRKGGARREFVPPDDVRALIEQSRPDSALENKQVTEAGKNIDAGGDDLVNIPCLNVKASAGYGNHVYEERVVGHFQVSRAWVRNVLNCDPGKVHIIFVDGPSMEPTLEDGELVLIDRRCEKFDNDAVYAIQFNGQLRIKRVQLRWDGTVVIKSDNPKFEPDILTQEQADQLHVIGKVLPWKFGKYKL